MKSFLLPSIVWRVVCRNKKHPKAPQHSITDPLFPIVPQDTSLRIDIDNLSVGPGEETRYDTPESEVSTTTIDRIDIHLNSGPNAAAALLTASRVKNQDTKLTIFLDTTYLRNKS
ncbi:hypothetical protein YC2023_091673 [Brassica napus]